MANIGILSFNRLFGNHHEPPMMIGCLSLTSISSTNISCFELAASIAGCVGIARLGIDTTISFDIPEK